MAETWVGSSGHYFRGLHRRALKPKRHELRPVSLFDRSVERRPNRGGEIYGGEDGWSVAITPPRIGEAANNIVSTASAG